MSLQKTIEMILTKFPHFKCNRNNSESHQTPHRTVEHKSQTYHKKGGPIVLANSFT